MMRILATLAIVLAASTAMAGWGHHGVAVAPVPAVAYYPAPVPVVAYYPAPVPVVAYYRAPTPVVTYYAPDCPVGGAPVVTAAPVYAPAAVGYVPGRYSVRFYPYGQPVRNVVRALLP